MVRGRKGGEGLLVHELSNLSSLIIELLQCGRQIISLSLSQAKSEVMSHIGARLELKLCVDTQLREHT